MSPRGEITDRRRQEARERGSGHHMVATKGPMTCELCTMDCIRSMDCRNPDCPYYPFGRLIPQGRKAGAAA